MYLQTNCKETELTNLPSFVSIYLFTNGVSNRKAVRLRCLPSRRYLRIYAHGRKETTDKVYRCEQRGETNFKAINDFCHKYRCKRG